MSPPVLLGFWAPRDTADVGAVGALRACDVSGDEEEAMGLPLSVHIRAPDCPPGAEPGSAQPEVALRAPSHDPEPQTLYRGWRAEQLKLGGGLALEKGSGQMSQEKGRKSLLV